VSASAPALAARLTRAWVRLYTHGLAADERRARRDELESDLWEHEHGRTTERVRPGRTAFEIVARLIAGMAADLSWRVEHRDPRRHTTRPLGGGTMNERLKKNGMVALAVGLGVWAVAVVPVLVGSEDWLQVAVSVFFGLLILGGLVAVHRGLTGGRLAVSIGAIGTGLLVVWLVVPAVIAIAIVIWLYATRKVQPATPPQPA
jgi:VIT1/CCC1 family predicted Fe2+/Mn2+ transporter